METTELKLREVQQLKSLAEFQIFSEPRDVGFLSRGESVDQFPLRCAVSLPTSTDANHDEVLYYGCRNHLRFLS